VHDVLVVGGGIVGLATARALALRGLSVVVLEREARLGQHQTTHNSGVIHAGIYYAPGSLKARLCVEGAAALYDYCAERGIEAVRCGKLVVALRRDDLPRLDELELRARANGVQGLARLGPDEVAAVEPHARGLSALHSPNTGMVDFGAVAAAYAADLEAHGGEIRRGAPVAALVEHEDHVEAVFARGEARRPGGETPSLAGAETRVCARRAVACAGAWSDRLALASGARPDVRIVPFRGAYLRLTRPELVRGQIYPVPDPALPFLGVHLSRTVAGEVLVGPTALLVPKLASLRWPGTARVVRRWWRTGVRELAHAASRRLLVREAARFVQAIGPGDVQRGPAGVRAQAVARDGGLVDDFLLVRTGRAVHVLNAPSPAATASLAIAEAIASEVA